MSIKRFLDFWIGIPLGWGVSFFLKKGEIPANPKKILIIKLAAVGDTILLGTVLQSFRAAHPAATIHWLVSPINKVMAKHFAGVDRLLVWAGGLGDLFPLVRMLRKENYDVVCDLEQWSRGTALLCAFSGVDCRLGFDTPGQHRSILFSHPLEKKYQQHEIDDFYDLLALLAPLDQSHRLNLLPSSEDQLECDQLAPLLDKNKIKVLIHPGCGEDGTPREWPLASYAVLGHWLMKKFDAQIILTSGPEETEKTKQLNRLLGRKAMDLGGQMSWGGLISLVSRMDLVVSGNTGVMHVAAALERKQVALHGPTNPMIWGPLNPNARVVQSSCPQCPCLKLGFEYHEKGQSCMQKIDVGTVEASIDQLIDRNS